MIAWLAGTIAVACLAVLAGRWRRWAAGHCARGDESNMTPPSC